MPFYVLFSSKFCFEILNFTFKDLQEPRLVWLAFHGKQEWQRFSTFVVDDNMLCVVLIRRDGSIQIQIQYFNWCIWTNTLDTLFSSFSLWLVRCQTLASNRIFKKGEVVKYLRYQNRMVTMAPSYLVTQRSFLECLKENNLGVTLVNYFVGLLRRKVW